MESGVFFSDGGKMIQSGIIVASGVDAFKQVNFNAGGFPSLSEYSVVSHVQTYNDDSFVKTRQKVGDQFGYSVALEQIGGGLDHVHGQEQIGWFAVESGVGVIGGLSFEAGRTPQTVDHTDFSLSFSTFTAVPSLFASIATFVGSDACQLRGREVTAAGATIFVQEETCGDDEVAHPNPEAVNYFAIDAASAPRIKANVQQLFTQGARSDFGEVGSVTSINNPDQEQAWTHIVLENDYEDPVRGPLHPPINLPKQPSYCPKS